MKKKTIWSLFDRLRPVIVETLMNPEVLAPPYARMFVYDGKDTDEEYGFFPVAQLEIPLKDEMTEILSPDEFFTPQQTRYDNVWDVYPDMEISLPWDGWQGNILFTIKTNGSKPYYILRISIVCYGFGNVVSHGLVMASGSVAEVAQAVKSDNFPGQASKVFNKCLETMTPEIEKWERQTRDERLFADTDITDYDSVMKFVDAVRDKKLLKSKGMGMELFEYDRVVALINRYAKSVKLLVDRHGQAQFCSIEDFPDELLTRIRMEESDWDLSVYKLSVGSFNTNGLSFVTWIISPYYYCPMDEDGFGEEEELEVAVTCHIDMNGRLADTPVWKPYTGPRR